MKIAQIACVYPPYSGGIGRSAEIFSELLCPDHEVTVFTPDYGRQKTGPKGYEIAYLRPWLRFGNGAWVPQLFTGLDKFDVIHLHYPFFGGMEAVWLAKKLHRSKAALVLHYHMDTAGLGRPAQILGLPARIIEPSLFRISKRIICASLDYIRESRMRGFYRKHSDKFAEIPFAVDTDRFCPPESPGKQGKNEILFVGGLDKAHYFKGLDLLLTALSGIKQKSWRLKIVGGGGMKPEYEKQSRRLGLADRVEFAGRLKEEDLIRSYQEADFLVLPSIDQSEAFGLVLIEAMACGCPVIASNLSGVRRVFADKRQGLQVKPRDISGLGQAIVRLLEDAGMRRQMGSAGRKLAVEKYNLPRLKNSLNDLYRRLE